MVKLNRGEHMVPSAYKGGALAEAMREVHANVPRNVVKASKKGKAKEAMLRAIAFSKAGESRKK